MKHTALMLATVMALTATAGFAAEGAKMEKHMEKPVHAASHTAAKHPAMAKPAAKMEKHEAKAKHDKMSLENDRYDNKHYNG